MEAVNDPVGQQPKKLSFETRIAEKVLTRLVNLRCRREAGLNCRSSIDYEAEAQAIRTYLP
jgi:hypothetical protein